MYETCTKSKPHATVPTVVQYVARKCAIKAHATQRTGVVRDEAMRENMDPQYEMIMATTTAQRTAQRTARARAEGR